MGGKPFFSIVMPVYNVQDYLSKAIDSILAQTFSDFELILVDDFSPDQCGKICDDYAEKDTRIRVVHLEQNGGLSNARNQGLKQVCGEYVWFPDSDDYVESYLLENVFQSLKRNPAELVVFGLQEDYYDANNCLKYMKTVSMEDHLLNEQHRVREMFIQLEKATLYGYAWNKVYRTSKLQKENLNYKQITLIEDIDFNVRYCMNITSMNVLSMTPYHYNKRMEMSLTSKYIKQYFKLNRQRILMIYKQYETWEMCTLEVKEILAQIYIRYIMSALERNCHRNSQMSFRQQMRWISALHKDWLFCELSKYYMPDSKLTQITGKIVVGRFRILSWLLGWGIYFVKSYMPIVFARLKHNK